SSVTSTGGNVTSTLTITTTGATPLGSYPFTVLAANGGGTCQSGTATGSGTLTVKANTTSTITSDSPDPSVVGQPVIVNYTVTSTSGTPTGNVTVSDGTVSCTGTVAAGTCSITFTTAGAKTLTATYAGDANFNGSTSAGASHQVNTASTTTSITSDTPDPSVIGQAVTINFSVAVTAPGSGTPAGNVTVSDG